MNESDPEFKRSTLIMNSGSSGFYKSKLVAWLLQFSENSVNQLLAINNVYQSLLLQMHYAVAPAKSMLNGFLSVDRSRASLHRTGYARQDFSLISPLTDCLPEV